MWNWLKKIWLAIWNCFKKFWLAIWKWLVNFFHPTKKPTVRITILLLLLTVLFFPQAGYSQRTNLESVVMYFYQPSIQLNSYWTIQWHSDVTESVDIYKNDTLRVKILNEEGYWVNWIECVDDANELDTMLVNIIVDRPYEYDTEFIFDIVARDTTGVESVPSENISVYFMASDINKIMDSDIEGGYIRGDYSVDGLDLIQLKRNWGKTGLGSSDYDDITGDGNIDGLDLIQQKRDWGRTHFP